MLYLWDLSSTARINQMSCQLKNIPLLCLGGPGSKSQSRDPNLKFCGYKLTLCTHTKTVSQNNLNNLGSDAWKEQKKLFSKTSTPVLSPPNIIFSEYWGVPSTGTKQPGHKANHSPPSRAEVKKEWSYTSTPYMCPHYVDRDNFTLNTHNRSGSQLLTDML